MCPKKPNKRNSRENQSMSLKCQFSVMQNIPKSDGGKFEIQSGLTQNTKSMENL